MRIQRYVKELLCVTHVLVFYKMPYIAAAQYIFVEIVLKHDIKSKNLLQKMLVWLSRHFYSLLENVLDHKLPS